MDEAEVLCDRVAVVDHGTVIALDTPKALITSLGAPKTIVHEGTLEDVFMTLTGRHLVTSDPMPVARSLPRRGARQRCSS